MNRRDRDVAGAFARARAGDRRLATWMWRHRDALLAELGSGRVDWRAPLAVFASLGLTDEHGQSLTRDTASRTWRRVRETVAAARRAEDRARPRSGELVRGVRLVVPAPAAPAASYAPPAAGTPASAVEATKHIAAALAAMGAARVPLPSQPLRQSPPAPIRPTLAEDPAP